MENTAKNFVLQLGSLVSLYISLGALIALLFGVINIAFPDDTEGYWRIEGAQEGIRFGIAMLIVFFPTYLTLTRTVNTTRRRESGTYLTLTKWLIYLSLLVGGAVLLGDLVAVINAFLNGEIVTRFVLKALAVFVVVGAAFLYYMLDARGYWQTHEKRSIEYGSVAALIVLGAIILGFYHSDTPTEVREQKLDEEQVRNLQDMQWRIDEYHRAEGELPGTIDEAYLGLSVPSAPELRKSYEYRITDDGFDLCAEFGHESTSGSEYPLRPISMDQSNIKNPSNWDHSSGWWCFQRVIN